MVFSNIDAIATQEHRPMLLKPNSFAFAQDVLQSEYELTCFGLSTAHPCSLLCCGMRQLLVDCSLFCVLTGPVPHESWVSLKADSGDNVTNLNFKASGSSGGASTCYGENTKGPVAILNNSSG